MPYRRIILEEKQPAHIVSRALIDVFRDEEDCYRFIFQFYIANLGKRGFNVKSKDAIKAGQALLNGEKISSKFVIEEHPPLVSLLDFSLVVNHYHFYLLPNFKNVISTFVQKLNCGFAQSFNLLHGRKDAVFGSRYGGIPTKTEYQSYATSRYVSIINPLDVFQPRWRENGLKDKEKAYDFLKSYDFSSFPDKIGKRNSRILASKEVLGQYNSLWNSTKEYQEFVKEFLKEKSTIDRSIFLE